jgi:hypothetical protein
MTRRPAFWIVFALASIGSAIVAYRLFPRAFPIVSLDIRMDREAALREARRLADGQHLGPSGYRQAASFELDEDVQTFVELEGGGKDAFARLMRDRLYAPYTWRVRHFKERETNETTIRFEPDGTPYGFTEHLSEDAPGTTIAADEARRVAESTASTVWHADLSPYQLVEQSQERKPLGRVDHRLVYERRDQQLGEGRYRLRLVVSGDRLTELTYFVRIPEAFQRRYEEMRAANNAIGAGSTIAMIVLYGVGGIVIGLFVLLRHRWVLWRAAVIWGFGIALLQVLDSFNQWPLLWMSYDTALSTRAFVAQQLGGALVAFFGFGVAFSLSFMAAESLTRRAFGHQPQLWRVWSREAAASPQILGRTVAGFLLVSLFFVYDVLLYYFATRVLGWWTPSEALFHPDVLAAYLPWFSAIAPSLQAGFWEECLFRAVPIAAAALIGDRIGQRRLAIAVAFVVQAIVFGGGHAPYPTQPSYARAVELILPSFGFGLIYLWLGLLPGIILHFVFDTVWFALPLFVSTAPGAWVNQAFVILCALIPIWIVVFARVRTGRWSDLPASLRNAAWSPPAIAVGPPPPVETSLSPLPSLTRRMLPVAGLAAAVAWLVVTPLRTEVPGIETGRATARDAALRAIREAGGTVTPAWRTMPTVDAGASDAHRFVFETAGRGTFVGLLGSYLQVPHWRVRHVTFEGDVADRAEEWRVEIEGNGSVRTVRHVLPEARPGPTIDEVRARSLASQFIEQRFGLRRDQVREVSLKPERLAARTDWQAVFADLDTRGLKQGELRIRVDIAGDQVVGAERFVYVPEEWDRRQRSERTVGLVMSLVGGLALIALLITEAIVAIVSWSRRAFAVRLFLAFLALQIVMRTMTSVNQWPVLEAAFSTAQPFKLQRLLVAVALAVGVTVPSAVLALIIGAAPIGARRSHSSPRQILGIGAALGTLAAAALAAGIRIRASGAPAWPAVNGADTLLPFASAALSVLSSYLLWSVGALVLIMAADQVTRGWTRWRIPVALLIVLVGISVAALDGQGTPLSWVMAGLIIGLLTLVAYAAVVRYELGALPIATATMMAWAAVRTAALGPFPGARAGALVGAVLVLAVGWWWSRLLRTAQA